MASEGRPGVGELSVAVQEAQARLLRLRAERGIQPERSDPPRPNDVSSGEPVSPNWLLRNAQKELRRRRASLSSAPDWPPPMVSVVYPAAPQPEPDMVQAEATAAPSPPTTVTVHPTMLMAILRHKQEAPARAWLLLRAIDGLGSGRLTVEDARRHLTDAASPWRCLGPRRLRQLLAQGEGLFWQRERHEVAQPCGPERLWLKSAAKIAWALDCDKVQGFPVELPVAALLGGIQGVRAAFYAAFHSGRPESPISRDTLATISGIPGRTQLEYDRTAGVARRRNFAVGECYSAERFQERAWQRGRAVFQFIDIEGRQGRADGQYVAWHLPNSYRANYQRRSRGSRKRLNRQLADLVQKGIPGNDGAAVERVFFANGGLAARQYNRGPERDVYWRPGGEAGAGSVVWRVIIGTGGLYKDA